jgi:RNA polymerase sigma factor (sigma-70 family)
MSTDPRASESTPIVHVVDDDAGVLDAVRLLLRSVGLKSRGYASATEFLASCDANAPGCLVLDLRMPGMSGVELQDRLLELRCDLPIVFITAHGDVPTAVKAVKAGAVDFIQKPFPDQKLLDKVHEALALDAANRAQRAERLEIRQRMAALTPRERDALGLVVAGLSNKRIAHELGISERTVEVHRARVMAKLQVSSVPELVRLALRAGEPAGSADRATAIRGDGHAHQQT